MSMRGRSDAFGSAGGAFGMMACGSMDRAGRAPHRLAGLRAAYVLCLPLVLSGVAGESMEAHAGDKTQLDPIAATWEMPGRFDWASDPAGWATKALPYADALLGRAAASQDRDGILAAQRIYEDMLRLRDRGVGIDWFSAGVGIGTAARLLTLGDDARPTLPQFEFDLRQRLALFGDFDEYTVLGILLEVARRLLAVASSQKLDGPAADADALFLAVAARSPVSMPSHMGDAHTGLVATLLILGDGSDDTLQRALQHFDRAQAMHYFDHLDEEARRQIRIEREKAVAVSRWAEKHHSAKGLALARTFAIAAAKSHGELAEGSLALILHVLGSSPWTVAQYYSWSDWPQLTAAAKALRSPTAGTEGGEYIVPGDPPGQAGGTLRAGRHLLAALRLQVGNGQVDPSLALIARDILIAAQAMLLESGDDGRAKALDPDIAFAQDLLETAAAADPASIWTREIHPPLKFFPATN